MILFPFICMGVGLVAGLSSISRPAAKYVGALMNAALVVIMSAIGINIGLNDFVMNSIGIIGLKCVAIAVFSAAFSVAFVLLLEHTAIRSAKMALGVTGEHTAKNSDSEKNGVFEVLGRFSPLFVPAGALFGWFIAPDGAAVITGAALNVSLAALYVSVGFGAGQSRDTFRRIKSIGIGIALVPAAITVGSVVGGALASLIFGVSPRNAVLSSFGMGYYSVTGAYMSGAFGAESGTYGFLTNIAREFLTILAVPFLSKLSRLSSVASGGAAAMDTVLAPITRFGGGDVGIIAFLVGCVLTVFVPALLPVLGRLFW